MVTLKVAVVHEWLVDYSGSERVLEQMLTIFPTADLFSIVDFVPESQRHYLAGRPVRTSFIQKLPGAKRNYRNYLPLMPLAIEQFDLSAYELVISNSHAVAKGILTGPNQLHLSYCHSPIRYAWDLQHQYLKESNLERGLKSLLVRYLLHRLRLWDYRTANGVDAFIANSQFIAKRIWKVYRRDARVIYPPVDTLGFELCQDKEDFYFTASRFVPYKKINLIVEAFAGMPNKKLVVIGDGPDYEKVKQRATANVTLLGYQPFSVLKDHMQRAKAFIFVAKEDFGIVPVEAQACGTPVIAFGEGGVLETVRGLDKDNPTGVLFEEQTPSSLQNAVTTFEQNHRRFEPEVIRQNALHFSVERFKQEFSTFVEEQWQAFTMSHKVT